MGIRKDTGYRQTPYINENVAGGQAFSLKTSYMDDIQQEYGSDTEWVILQEICIAVVCDGNEIAEIFGSRRIITLTGNAIEGQCVNSFELLKISFKTMCYFPLSVPIAPNCTYLIPETPTSSTLEGMNTIMYNAYSRSAMSLCKLYSLLRSLIAAVMVTSMLTAPVTTRTSVRAAPITLTDEMGVTPTPTQPPQVANSEYICN